MGRKPKEPDTYTLVNPYSETHVDVTRHAALEDVNAAIEERKLTLENILVFPCAPLKLEKRLTIARENGEPKAEKKPRKPRTPKPINGKDEPKIKVTLADEDAPPVRE